MRGSIALLLLASSSFATPLDDLTARAEAAAIGPLDQLATSRAALLQAIPAEPLTYGGQAVPLDWLREAATDGDRQELVRAWERLTAWRDAAQPGPDLIPERVRAETAAILGRDEYRPLRAASWIDPWLPYVERFFDWLFAPFTRRSADAESPAVGIGVALYTLLSLLLAVGLARRLRRRDRRRAAELPASSGQAAAAPTGEAWRRVAERELAAGRDAAAFAAAWRGLLRRMDESGVLPYDPSRTPRETAAAVTAPELAAKLRALAQVAEASWYDGQAVGAAEVRAVLDAGEAAGSGG